MDNAIHFEPVMQQSVIAQAITEANPDASVLDGLHNRDIRLINAGTLGLPFERFVSGALRSAGTTPLVANTSRIGSLTISPTNLHGGVLITDGHVVKLELDSLLRAHSLSFLPTPLIVEIKTGKPHNAFCDSRLQGIIEVAGAISGQRNIGAETRVAFTVVTPSRGVFTGMRPWERDIEDAGGTVVRTKFTLGDFHRKLVSLIRTRT